MWIIDKTTAENAGREHFVRDVYFDYVTTECGILMNANYIREAIKATVRCMHCTRESVKSK